MALAEIDWPSTLPAVPVVEDAGGLVEGLPENLSVSRDTDSGKPVDRPRVSAYFRTWMIPLVVKSAARRDRLEDFYFYDCAVGTLPFNWPGWVRRGSSVFRFAPKSRPEFVHLGNDVWRCSFELWQFPDGAV